MPKFLVTINAYLTEKHYHVVEAEDDIAAADIALETYGFADADVYAVALLPESKVASAKQLSFNFSE